MPTASAVGVVAVAAAAVLIFQAVEGGGRVGLAVGPKPSAGGGPVVKAAPGTKGATKPQPPRPPVPQGKEVVVASPDGTFTVESDFKSAIHAAVGGRGYVLLLNAQPLTLTAADAVNISGGPLTIRAGDGMRPVLKVEVKGNNPFLATRGDAPLRIEGVTIEAKFIDPGPEPAAVIEAGANVVLDRCAFRVEGATGPAPGTRAVALDGGSLKAVGCWFENFERALDLSLFGGANVEARHCQFIGSRGATAEAAAGSGWAARLKAMPGGFAKTGRKLTMDHCTAQGRGFLEFVGFSPEKALTVDLKGCAVLADALVGWESPKPPDRNALSWLGQNDQLDLRGSSWVWLVSPGSPPAPMPGGPSDLETWNKSTGTEHAPVPPPVRFATDPSSLSEAPEPKDFALAEPGASRGVGADPKHVGPGTRAVDGGR